MTLIHPLLVFVDTQLKVTPMPFLAPLRMIRRSNLYPTLVLVVEDSVRWLTGPLVLRITINLTHVLLLLLVLIVDLQYLASPEPLI